MSFPIEGYTFYTYKNENDGMTIVAISTYAGKTVRGMAKCDPKDEFDYELGKALAAARCNAKVCAKRVARAKGKAHEAAAALVEATKKVGKVRDYLNDSIDELAKANEELAELEKKMRE